ncbi:MAG TPA: TetR/AcrR family transcriptional regulator [Solirubrobacteraceae bacterium]|nr:TetR/AcrR family transcriptional regulator [Solirubrobacteraceae bacterium]
MFFEIGAGQTPAQGVSCRDPRGRLLEATIETVSLRGYDRSTVSRILSVAGLDDAVFDEHFHDKRDCFWQALDELLGRGECAALELFALKLPWAERVALGIERLLQALADDPATARVLLVEVFGAGPEACERRRVAVSLLTSLMEHGRAEGAGGAQLPPQTSEAVVGGVLSILHRRALQGETDGLPALRADLTYFALLPYLDHERALAVANRQSGVSVSTSAA